MCGGELFPKEKGQRRVVKGWSTRSTSIHDVLKIAVFFFHRRQSPWSLWFRRVGCWPLQLETSLWFW
jgi:hypothetical protein